MSLVVRVAEPDEAAVIAELNCLMAAESEGLALDPEIVLAGAEAMLSDPARGRYLVAVASGTIVGQLALTPEWSDWRAGWFWWIQSVYVRPDWRRRGVFRALLAKAMQQTEADCGLRLYVHEHNLGALATYHRLGFVDEGYRVLATPDRLRADEQS